MTLKMNCFTNSSEAKGVSRIAIESRKEKGGLTGSKSGLGLKENFVGLIARGLA
jgi:hypothetical protein